LDANPERFVSDVRKGKFASFVDGGDGRPIHAQEIAIERAAGK
jgi:hypothetical protein